MFVFSLRNSGFFKFPAVGEENDLPTGHWQSRFLGETQFQIKDNRFLNGHSKHGSAFAAFLVPVLASGGL